MADDVKSRKLSAREIMQTLDDGRTFMWTNWMKERQLTTFYNSGSLPQDDEECGDDAPVSLGVGYRYIKRPLDQLLDTVLTKPGFIKTEVCYPLEAKRQFKVSRDADEEINKIVQPRMASIMRALCGRAMITGRGYLFRLSRWDWKFRTGRLICAPDAPDDVMDSDFRDWGFTGKLTLRDIDERIEMTRKYPGYYGWGHDALMSLKRYIIRTTFAEKDATEEWVAGQAMRPFDVANRSRILDVYWYFAKNGERNEESGEEKVDMYCVSRWGSGSGIYSEEVGGVVYKALEVKSPESGNEVMYFLPNAFESVKECLLPMILDARIDGEQEMNQVDGVGKIMLPRLQSMEHLSMALLEGVGFGVQPNWQYSNAVDAKTIELLGKTGLNPWDAVPAGLSIMQKSQSFQGLNQALQMLQMLGMSAESDAQTGEMSPLGQSQAKFKAEADMLMAQIDVGMSRRKEMSFICLDELAEKITETLSRPFDQWKKGDAGYYDALQFQRRMLMVHKVLPAEYSPERMKATCRRLAGNMDRNQAGMKAAQTLQIAGGAMAPEGVRFFQKEIVRAGYDDNIADYVLPDEPPEQNQDQVMAAQLQNSMALVSLMVPLRQPIDNPMIHLPQHIMALEARLRLAQQAGGCTMFEREGMSALLVHCSQDAQGVPEQRQQQVGMFLKQIATAIQNMPLLNETNDLAIKQQKLQLEAGKLQLSAAHEDNLVADRAVKNDMKSKALMIQLHQFLEQQKNNGVTRAAQLLGMMDDAAEPAQSEVAPSAVAA